MAADGQPPTQGRGEEWAAHPRVLVLGVRSAQGASRRHDGSPTLRALGRGPAIGMWSGERGRRRGARARITSIVWVTAGLQAARPLPRTQYEQVPTCTRLAWLRLPILLSHVVPGGDVPRRPGSQRRSCPRYASSTSRMATERSRYKVCRRAHDVGHGRHPRVHVEPGRGGAGHQGESSVIDSMLAARIRALNR